MANPNTQIDDLIKEMTDEEFDAFQALQESSPSPLVPQE